MLLEQFKPTRWGYKESYPEMGRKENVCVLCVKALRRMKPFCLRGELGPCSAVFGWREVLGVPGAQGALVAPAPVALAAVPQHWYPPGVIMVTHQTWTALGCRADIADVSEYAFFSYHEPQGTSNTVQRNGNGQRRFAHCSCYSK